MEKSKYSSSVKEKKLTITEQSRWVDHLEKHNMVTEKQLRCKKGMSCMTILFSYFDRVADALQERDGWVDTVFLDFKSCREGFP